MESSLRAKLHRKILAFNPVLTLPVQCVMVFARESSLPVHARISPVAR